MLVKDLGWHLLPSYIESWIGFFSLRFWDAVWLGTLLRWAHKENSKGLAQWLMFGSGVRASDSGSQIQTPGQYGPGHKLSTESRDNGSIYLLWFLWTKNYMCVCCVRWFWAIQLLFILIIIMVTQFAWRNPTAGVSPGFKPASSLLRSSYILVRALHIADSTLLISACRRGPPESPLSRFDCSSPHIHPFTPHFMLPLITQISNR